MILGIQRAIGALLVIVGIILVTTQLPLYSTGASSTQSIQAMVDAAPAGSVVSVPPGIYRETVTITKPLTLQAQPGAEIRGSDVWSDGWTRQGDYWVRGTLPGFGNDFGECQPDSGNTCTWQEQVFVDGQPLVQVAENPQPGQFAATPHRQIVLADNPSGRVVEVTLREFWVIGSADNVTVDGFSMTHAANPAQTGGINNGGQSNWTISNNTFSHAHGANVSIFSGTNLQVLNNTIHNGGQLGLHVSQATDALVQGNRMWANNNGGYDMFWEAGGMKISGSRSLKIHGNEVYSNTGKGIWIDVFSNSIEISENRVHHNSTAGILHELSSNGKIHNNVIWENGHSVVQGPGGAGIFVQESRDTQVFENTVAWNGNGIVMWADNRGVGYVNNLVRNNDVFIVSHRSWDVHGLAWRQWDGDTSMAAPGANNRSENNRFYHANPDKASSNTFVWIDDQHNWGDLDQFNTLLGQHGNTYMSGDALSLLTSAGVPPSYSSLSDSQIEAAHAGPATTISDQKQLLPNPTVSEIHDAFWDFWHRNGGLPVFGYPLTYAFEQINPETNQVITVQYMERQRFEHHPELAGTPYEIMIGRFGVTYAEQRGLLETEPFQPLAENPGSDDCAFFSETGHSLCSRFLDYWQYHGLDMGDEGVSHRESVALFGFPISEVFVDPETGLESQYFERAVFEYHPEHAGTEFEVLLVRHDAQELAGRDW